MRLDRFLTLKVVHPFRQAFAAPKRSDGGSAPGRFLPILMYHSISDDTEPGVHPYYRVCTGSQQFRKQMQWLKDSGCRGVTLSAGLAWLNGPSGAQVANSELRPVVITFDDGFRDFYTAAWPILSEFGFAATMFLPTAFIGETRRSFKSRPCMIWNEVHELYRAGIEFGSHTLTHPKLTEVDRPQINSELQDSKKEIENQLGGPCQTFAYPFAFPETNRQFVQQFRDALTETGYYCCATTRLGHVRPGDDLMQLKRLPVNSGDDLEFFQAKLAGAYNWVTVPQTFSKKIRHDFFKSRRAGAVSQDTV